MNNLSTAVVVLNWNGRHLLEQFVPSWLAHTPPNAELIIVDNGSTDDSVSYLQAHYPQIKLLLFTENYGFAEGYNRAIRLLENPVIVLLNSDVALSEGWLSEPLELLERKPHLAAIQPKIRAYRSPESFEYAGAAGGYLDRDGYPFCRGRLLGTIEADHGQYDQPVEDLFWASGACLIIRRRDYLDAGGLDARFFAHQEEIDLCWRLNARGRRIALAPRSVVYHVGGASLEADHPKKTYLNFRNNLLMLYKNLPSDRLGEVLSRRCALDAIALLAFLLRGKWQHARAVALAYRDYWRMRPDFAQARAQNLARTVDQHPLGIKSYSLLKRYYLQRCRVYSALED